MLAAMDSCFGVIERQGLPLNGLTASARSYKQLFGSNFGPHQHSKANKQVRFPQKITVWKLVKLPHGEVAPPKST